MDPLSLRALKPYQKVNKFPKASCLTLKANLWTSFLRMQTHFGPAAFGYMPQTCVLPSQLEMLEARRHPPLPWTAPLRPLHTHTRFCVHRNGWRRPKTMRRCG